MPLHHTEVYVVAWDSEGSGGFDWYFRPDEADEAYEKEKENADKFKVNQWTAYRFNYTPTATNRNEITEEIDSKLVELCDNASVKYGYRA